MTTESLTNLYTNGGFIMVLLTLASIVSVAIIVYKYRSLKEEDIIPQNLIESINLYVNIGDQPSVNKLEETMSERSSVLCKLAKLTVKRGSAHVDDAKEAIQSAARDEVLTMQDGIQVLDVVIVVAPLLGLLGTASGIMTVFEGFGGIENIEMNVMAKGVAKALSTTVVGLFVTVPAVIAQSYFIRKIERYASQLEMTLESLLSALRHNLG